MTIPVVWLSLKDGTPARGYWDHGMLEALFAGSLWRTPLWPEFEHYEGLTQSFAEKGHTGAVVIFPARAQTDCAQELNLALARLEWVVLILTGDEESSFPFDQIRHPNMRVWVMSARPKHGGVRKLGTGWPPQIRAHLPVELPAKTIDVFFAGQITHQRRQELAEQMQELLVRSDMKASYYPSEGFTQGLPPEEYYRRLANAKVAPAPSGPETPDSFRLFEALEAGCVPIADALAPKGEWPKDYWTWFFGEEPPFPVLTKYEQLTGYVLEAINDWPRIGNKVFAWWQGYKRKLVEQMLLDIYYCLGKPKTAEKLEDLITVIIPSSPIAAHPSTEAIEQTISDVRAQLPNCEIIITLDGVRKEQSSYAKNYEEYKRRLLWLTNNRWSNVLPVVFDKHMHQASMAREALKLVRTPLILYVEHDAPVTPDRVIEWERLCEAVLSGEANIIRLHHEELILLEHKHLMLGEPENGLQRTSQWSQRPHLASAEFYRMMLEAHFHPESKTMIEDVMHGIVHEAVERGGMMGWYAWRLWVYTPTIDALGIKRSYHLDSRGKDPKYEMIIKPVRK